MLKKSLFGAIFFTLIFAFGVSAEAGVKSMRELKEHLVPFRGKDYSRIGENPFFAGGIPRAKREGKLDEFQEKLRASLKKENIFVDDLSLEFNLIGEGKERRTRLKDGDFFYSVNQKGGNFVKAPRMYPGDPKRKQRKMFEANIGRDIPGTLIVLQDYRRLDRWGRPKLIVVLIADECGNAFLLPPHTGCASVEIKKYQDGHDEEVVHIDDLATRLGR